MKLYAFVDKISLHHSRLNGMIPFMNRRRILVLATWLIVCSIVPLFAFQFSPLEQEFAPSGANSTKTYTIVNDSNDSIAVEITALTRDIDASGNEINRSAAAYFSIVPSKMILRPQSSQIVRVQYRGPRTVPVELPFRIRAEQIPYTQGRAAEGQSMFNFLYVYTTSAYVTPTRSLSRVVIDSAVPTITEDGRQVVTITVTNSGTVRQILTDAKIELLHNATRQSVVYEGAALGFVNGMNLLAGKSVTVQVAWPSNMTFPTQAADRERFFSARITYSN